MARVISVFSPKGGVGKTSLSFSISKDLNLSYITNDISTVLKKHKKSKYVKNKIPYRENTLYDFGGFYDKNTDEIIKLSDILLIPTINDQNSFIKTLDTIKKFNGFVEIIVIGTMIENDKDKENIKKHIGVKYPNIRIIFLKRTKAFKNSLEEGISIKDLVSISKLNKHRYKGIYKNYLKLTNEINNYI